MTHWFNDSLTDWSILEVDPPTTSSYRQATFNFNVDSAWRRLPICSWAGFTLLELLSKNINSELLTWPAAKVLWIFNKHVIANFPQSVPVKNFKNRSIFGEDIQTYVHKFLKCNKLNQAKQSLNQRRGVWWQVFDSVFKRSKAFAELIALN